MTGFCFSPMDLRNNASSIGVLRRGRPAALLMVIALLLAMKRHAGIVHNVAIVTARCRCSEE